MEVVCQQLEVTPISGQVLEDYEIGKERIQVSNYQQDGPKKIETMSIHHAAQQPWFWAPIRPM